MQIYKTATKQNAPASSPEHSAFDSENHEYLRFLWYIQPNKLKDGSRNQT